VQREKQIANLLALLEAKDAQIAEYQHANNGECRSRSRPRTAVHQLPRVT